MKTSLIWAVTALSMTGTVACNKGSTSDPSTVTRDELNPPGHLQSMTGDKNIELYWTKGNTEDDFVGYYAFAVKSAIASLPAVAYPAKTDMTKGGAVPRCKDNDAFFKAFGFPTQDRDCEGAAATSADSKTSASGMMLADSTTTSEKVEKLTNWVPCETGGTADISIKADKASGLGTQTCKITKAWNGTEPEDLQNGELYTMFVVAVAKDDHSVLSWTSNAIEDSPSADAFDGTVTLAQHEYAVVSFDATTKDKVTIADGDNATSCTTDTSAAGAGPCWVTGQNAVDTNGLFIARDTATLHPERLLLSSSTGSSNEFAIEQVTDTDSIRQLGDEPTTHDYSGKGTKIQILENSLFDITWTKGAEKRYGKIAFGAATYESNSGQGTVTLPVKVVVQPGAGVKHYFQ